MKIGKKPKSAGAMLRRHGEEQLREESRKLLRDDWGHLLKNCSMIFYAVPRTMLPILFNHSGPQNKDAPLDREDVRLRPTSCCNQPSLQEVKDIHKRLSTVEIYDNDNLKRRVELVAPKVSTIPTTTTTMTKPNAGKKEAEDTNKKMPPLKEQEIVFKPARPPNELFEAVLQNDLSLLKTLIAARSNNNNTDSGEGKLEEDEEAKINVSGGGVMDLLSEMLSSTDVNGLTPLHLASQQNRGDMVQLLLDSGANPSLLDSHLRPPYYLTESKEVRDCFRRYRAQCPDQWDWTKAQVPEPLTDELIEKKKEKEREKKKRQREREKQKKKEAQEQADKEKAEQEKKDEIARLEQLKLDEAIRLGSICDGCGGAIKKGNVFTRLSYKYCSPACTQAHRRALMCEAAESRMKK
jgi:hypothetical protein